MKQTLTFILIFLAAITSNAQVVLLQETFQDWTAEPGTPPVAPSKAYSGLPYSITKKLFDGKTDGTFTSNALIAAPGQSIGSPGAAEGNGSPSKGRIALRGTSTYLQLPELPSVGKVNIKANAGTDLKEFKLQVSTGGSFEDIPGTVTACSKTVTKLFTFNLSYSSPTTLRIVPVSNSSIFFYDLEVYSFPKR
ncbi:MAG: hypothetical protein NT144_12590 [Bacteroidia bacterium]|nr:hypothetical protein [Bacteroidia bacterium]